MDTIARVMSNVVKKLTDIYQKIEANYQNIEYFEKKNGKRKIQRLQLNGTNLALVEFGHAYLQKQLHTKQVRLVGCLQ
jgi:hypothetical protein